MNFTNGELKQIKSHGLTIEEVFNQIETFVNGIPFVDIITAASIGNGIESVSRENQEKLACFFEDKKEGLDIVKFVPASGAATRMFKFLHEFLEDYDPDEEDLRDYLKDDTKKGLRLFFDSYQEFAFINDVRKVIRKKFPGYKHGKKGLRYKMFVRVMLNEEGLNFNLLPKGLIPFHQYKKYATTAFEEQLYESAFYASISGDAHLHFTFSEKHLPFFKEKFKSVKSRVSKKTKTEFHISYSFQKKETDTLAVKPDNTPFRGKDGQLLFRPSGHGALLSNLNDVDTDIIFVKNIDNVIAEEYVEEMVFYKKVLAGKMLWIQQKIFAYLRKLNKVEVSQETLDEIKSFLWNELNIKDIPTELHIIRAVLNRPRRVCGVVKNTGSPGGGPFWIKNDRGETSLQIVEMSQIDSQNRRLQNLVSEATHFNPVDIVCGVRDYQGNKFDLLKFTDPNSGIITEKSQEGKPVKALELPGLWNGSMANWNTALVEVPISTFNPVKTVNDLLKKEHRPNA